MLGDVALLLAQVLNLLRRSFREPREALSNAATNRSSLATSVARRLSMSAELNVARSSAYLCRSLSSRSPWTRNCSVNVSSTPVERSAGGQLLAELLGAFAPALEHSLSVLELELRRALQGLRLIEPGASSPSNSSSCASSTSSLAMCA